jgi:2-deoxy-D-gluconate 3-dehydrogenase
METAARTGGAFMDPFDLRSEVAIVTGGNGGIGRGIAEALAAAGAAVVIAARNEEKSAGAVAAIEAAGGRALAVACDVTRQADIDATVAATTAAFGPASILVNNSGIARQASPQRMTDDQWDEVVSTNLTACFKFARACYPGMKELGRGKIINIGSEYSLFGSAAVVSYSASKGGVVQLTKSLAVAWAPNNIQVNCIIPGWIVTDMTARGHEDPEFNARILGRTPAGRWGEPDDCGGPAVFLASRASDFVTGVSIPVDGGYAVA